MPVELQDIGGLKIMTPSDQQFQVQAEKQKKEMGATVDQVFSSQNASEAVRRLHRKRMDEQKRISNMNYDKISVINLMPFPLNISGVLHGRLAGPDGNQVPACKVGEDYARLVIEELAWAIRDEGAGMDNVDNYTPVSFSPTELAEDYIREFIHRMGVGGVFVYPGVDDPKKTRQTELKQARTARNQWLLRKVQEAEADWADSSGRGRRNITDLHRKAAEVLLYDKVLKHQPAWLLALNSDGSALPDPCPGCGDVADRRAAICKSCRYVFKPVEAFKAALIAYDHLSMQRLTKDEWKEVDAIRAKREEARAAASN